jgi:hypothetical protein
MKLGVRRQNWKKRDALKSNKKAICGSAEAVWGLKTKIT